MASKEWLLYGANGYTGELIARRAVSRGMKPVLAGRSPAKIEALAKELRLEYRVFGLEDLETIKKNIRSFSLVLHCAGPFISTSVPMAEACIAQKVHYLDITGEIPVYESLFSLNQSAQEAGILLLPGVGFDIVPTDCVAAALEKKLPSASELDLAFVGLSEVSPGTMKSALAQLPYGSKIRKNGELVGVPHLSSSKTISIKDKTYRVYGIPWGDVFTAYISTGIPNIQVFTDIPEGQVKAMKYLKPFLTILKFSPILKLMQFLVGKTVRGPGEETRINVKTRVWGEVRAQSGKSISLLLECKEGYEFTIESSILAVQKVLNWKGGKGGFRTPSLAFGSDFVLEVSGSKWEFIERKE